MRRPLQILACGVVAILTSTIGLRASGSLNTESAAVSGDWGVWSGWFWPFNATQPPNLYGDDEALSRYDSFAGSNSQSWEQANHGPSLNQPDWAGHCHAWAGASVWEPMPTAERVVGGVTFRPRDLAALVTEAYYNDTLATEISLYHPSPGMVWRYLRQEIMGQNPMHGHAMALIGNLTTIKGEVWNFPIYQYETDYAQDASGTYSGTITVWFADDGNPGYADFLGLNAVSYSYAFSAVTLDASGVPLDSGNWAGSDPSQFPTTFWRPYCRSSWSSYLANSGLDGIHLAQILDSGSPGDTGNATVTTSPSPSARGVTSGDGTVTPGTTMTVCAVANAGCSFANWTEDGQIVSTSSCYTFAATTDHALVANFILNPPVLGMTKVRDQVVVSWSTNYGGYQLESCTNLNSQGTWIGVTPNPVVWGANYCVTNSANVGLPVLPPPAAVSCPVSGQPGGSSDTACAITPLKR